MAYTLSDLLQDVYSELGQLSVGVATNGSASSLVDDELVGAHQDDEWKDGVLFILDAQGEAPENEFARISGFEASSGTLNLAEALSAAVADGQRYGLASAYYPIDTVVELVNSGLRALGDIPLVDEESLVSVGGQGSYVAALDWTRRRPTRIDFQAIPGLSGTDPWRKLNDWDFVPSAPGSNGLILFKDALPAGRKLRVWYQGSHPKVSEPSDAIAQVLAPELVVAACVERTLRWQSARLGDGDAHIASRWQQAKINLNEAKALFPIWKPRRRAKLFSGTRKF